MQAESNSARHGSNTHIWLSATLDAFSAYQGSLSVINQKYTYRVRQKSSPLKFFAFFSATA